MLIVPTPGTGPEDILNAQDDLQIMSRLLAKQMEQAGIAPPGDNTSFMMYNMMMAGPYGSSFSRSSAQSLYLAGYGAVFQLKVEFPLVALAQTDQTDSQEDSLCAQTRLELQDPEAARRAQEKDKQDVPTYDPEKVEDLKETLVKTLKYTRNIRALQPNEKVVIVVTSMADLGESAPMPYYTTLAMDAGKADIDQFAGGDLSNEQFKGKVKSMMY